MFLPRQLFRIIGLLLCTLALAGCGTLTRFTYNQANDLLYWWLDAYVDFNAQQSPRAREELAGLVQWHRKTQLPVYADILQQVQQLAAQNLSADQACAVADEVRAKLLAISTRVEPAMAWFASTVTPQQLEHLQRKYDKNIEEYERDWRGLSAADLRKKRIKQARSRSELLYGKLDAAQVAVIAATVDESRVNMDAVHTERLRRHQDTLQTLRKIAADKPPLADVQLQMRALLERSINSPNPAYKAQQDALWREGCTSFARVHNATTPEQRARALEALQGYESDFRALAGQKG
jgi:hypothetical protein